MKSQRNRNFHKYSSPFIYVFAVYQCAGKNLSHKFHLLFVKSISIVTNILDIHVSFNP